jgi:hypothetical protein
MAEPRSILRWLTVAAVLQVTLLFLVDIVFTRRLRAVGSSLRDSLNGGGVAAEQVDNLNLAFSSILNDVYWLFLTGIVLTCVGSALLRGIIKKSPPKPSPSDHESS